MKQLDTGTAEFCFDPAQERAVSALRRWVEMMESAVRQQVAAQSAVSSRMSTFEASITASRQPGPKSAQSRS